MNTYLYPETYVEEISVFPPFVDEVDSTIAAFVGYTAKASITTVDDLVLVPTKIGSMKEYDLFFGTTYESDIELKVSKASNGKLSITGTIEASRPYNLYYSVAAYFANGGSSCYIVSVGLYEASQRVQLSKIMGLPGYGLLDGLNELEEVSDISLLLIPESVNLNNADYSMLVRSVLQHCAHMGTRFAIFDLFEGDKPDPDLSILRDMFGSENLSNGCVYYPFVWINRNFVVNSDETNVKIWFNGSCQYLNQIKKSDRQLYRFVRRSLLKWPLALPSAGAVAGAYVTTDLLKGVWKSPANLKLSGVEMPVVDLTNSQQELLNVDSEGGKSINSIRNFAERGTLVWGARTLAGNDNDWRYVPCRRFFIMVKESLVTSTHWAVFEPNDTGTWMKVRAMIETYLTLKWQNGALAGIHAHQAFYVKCGLGSTMSKLDILEGRLNVEVGLAILRPAEFIVFRFSHQVNL